MEVSDLHRSLGLESRTPHTLLSTDAGEKVYPSVCPLRSHKPLEEIFRARVIQLLVELDLFKADRVKLVYSWKHTGFNVHRGESVGPNKSLLTQLA